MTKNIKKISSEDLLQELIDRKVLTQIPVGLYKEFELKRKYRDRDKPIHYDGVFLLNSSQQSFNDELSGRKTTPASNQFILKVIRDFKI